MTQDGGTLELMLRIQGLPVWIVSVNMVVHTHTHTERINRERHPINKHQGFCPCPARVRTAAGHVTCIHD
jgi:hypothetical protein